MSLFRVQSASVQKPKPKQSVKEEEPDYDIRPKFTFGRCVSDMPPPQQKIVAGVTGVPAGTPFIELPNCTEKIMGCAGWLNGISLFRELGNHSGQVYLRRRLEKASGEQGFERKHMTHEWDPSTKQWYELPVPKGQDDYLEWGVPSHGLDSFATWALDRSRKTKDEKLRLLSKFGVQLTDQESEKLKGPIENELLGVLSQCLPFKIEYQYRVGKYRLDAFIPRLHLAIQIDEHGHRGYDPVEEKEYDEVIRDHNIVCIRFNPDQKYAVPAKYELIRLVWERTLSPDFSAFREKLKLV